MRIDGRYKRIFLHPDKNNLRPRLRLDVPLVDTEEFAHIQTRTRQDPGQRLEVKLVYTKEYNRIQTKFR